MRYPLDPTETKWLIGQEWKCSNAWSGLILIGRKFDQEEVRERVKDAQIVAKLVISFEGLEGEPEGLKNIR